MIAFKKLAPVLLSEVAMKKQKLPIVVQVREVILHPYQMELVCFRSEELKMKMRFVVIQVRLLTAESHHHQNHALTMLDTGDSLITFANNS